MRCLLSLLPLLLLLPSTLSSPPLPPSTLISRSYSTSLSTIAPSLTSWRLRISSRGLTIPNFGSKAIQILDATEDVYDGLTTSIISSDTKSRRLYKSKLMDHLHSQITELYDLQILRVTSDVVEGFKRDMLRNFRVDKKTGKEVEGKEEGGDVLRRWMEEWEKRTAGLEVESLGLLKTPHTQSLSNTLSTLLSNFSTSPPAQLKVMSAIQSSASKPKPPSERGITPTFHLVSMFRPDGFGNLQGFAGYTGKGGNTVTCGVCNDADSPEVLNAFGGMRPPVLRVQGKVNLDVDL